MNLDTKSWKTFRFGDLISEIYKAKAYKDEDLSFSKKLTEDSIPYVTRTDLNNGVKAFALRERLENIEKGNALVIGDTTATISYQKDDFIAGDHIVIVRTNWLNEYTGLFVMTLLKKESYRYSYGRAFKIDIIKETALKLPADSEGKADWAFMENYIKSLHNKAVTTKIRLKKTSLDTQNWGKFIFSDIFTIQNGKGIKKEEIEEFPGDFPAVQSGEINNGILGFIDKDYCKEMNYTFTDEPCLTVARTGTAGFVAFQAKGCVVGDSAKILLLRNKDFKNKYVYLFLATILNANRYKFSYGRKVTEEKYKDLILKLPATTDGTPDFAFMERYIKSLPYSDRI